MVSDDRNPLGRRKASTGDFEDETVGVPGVGNGSSE